MATLRVALIQLSAGDDFEANCTQAIEWIGRAAAAHPDLIALPETFLYRGRLDGFLASAVPMPGPLIERFGEVAHDAHAWLLLGSLAETSPDPRRPYNTSVLLDPEGNIAARYRKRHLFDVSVDDDKRELLYAAQTECCVLWTTRDGWPVGVMHRYVWHDGRFWITCTSARKRVAALRARPQSAVVVSSEGTWLGGDITTTASFVSA